MPRREDVLARNANSVLASAGATIAVGVVVGRPSGRTALRGGLRGCGHEGEARQHASSQAGTTQTLGLHNSPWASSVIGHKHFTFKVNRLSMSDECAHESSEVTPGVLNLTNTK